MTSSGGYADRRYDFPVGPDGSGFRFSVSPARPTWVSVKLNAESVIVNTLEPLVLKGELVGAIAAGYHLQEGPQALDPVRLNAAPEARCYVVGCLSKTEVACAKSFECAAVRCNYVRIDRFGSGDEPRAILA